ncbi:hypothetical protein Swit_4872 [Rhizorhabdus wittichii RW1]|uniref:Uncharacterized protein n=1 Tax=Rhizorhabdus wittichii (strain DSM 6014 / CCUG 31198 / JCM 15750 / NBRC 105917 / EY 4224 / RW1) TaxID=392499 RepID=A0A9J9LG26_RHIWR|nr:hypothetical protein Swit_4872 [Rhizorhabdus wittichii RW1]
MRLLTSGALLVAACLSPTFILAAPESVAHTSRSVTPSDCRLDAQSGGSSGQRYIFICGKDGVSLGISHNAVLRYSASLGRYLAVLDGPASKAVLLAWPRAGGSSPVIEDMGRDIAVAAFGEGADSNLGEADIDSTRFADSNVIKVSGSRGSAEVEFVADGIVTRVKRR